MLEITLMKSLYHEMDSEKIPEVEEFTNEESSRFRKMPFTLPEFPELHSITSEVRYMAYGVAMYYLHINDDLETEEDINQPMAKAAILQFFRTYQPSYFRDDLPEETEELSTLDYFDAGKIPDYRPKYAFPNLIMYEDLKNGKVPSSDSSFPTFPGIRMLNREDQEDKKPAYIAKDEEYTEFNGNNDDFQKKLEELKAKFPLGM
jgi:hypothetical protein